MGESSQLPGTFSMDTRVKPAYDGRVVAVPVTLLLTFVPISVTSPRISLVEGRFSRRSLKRSECGSRGRGS